MTARVPASDRTRKRIVDVLSGDFDQSALLRNAVRLIIEEALEAEVIDVLGRGYYECVFHANWTAVPWQSGRWFHGKVDSWSDATRGAGTIYSWVDSSVKVG